MKSTVLKYAMQRDIRDKRKRNKIFYLLRRIKTRKTLTLFPVMQTLILQKVTSR